MSRAAAGNEVRSPAVQQRAAWGVSICSRRVVSVALDDAVSALVRERGKHLVRVAYQLTHDRGAAEDIVQEALYQVCRSWSVRSGQPDRLEAYVRRAVINEFLKRQSRRANSEMPTGTVAERPANGSFENLLAERDAVWRALDLTETASGAGPPKL